MHKFLYLATLPNLFVLTEFFIVIIESLEFSTYMIIKGRIQQIAASDNKQAT